MYSVIKLISNLQQTKNNRYVDICVRYDTLLTLFHYLNNIFIHRRKGMRTDAHLYKYHECIV